LTSIQDFHYAHPLLSFSALSPNHGGFFRHFPQFFHANSGRLIIPLTLPSISGKISYALIIVQEPRYLNR
jgi:hypothetical protein